MRGWHLIHAFQFKLFELQQFATLLLPNHWSASMENLKLWKEDNISRCALLLFQSMESGTSLDGKYITRRRRGVIGAGTAPMALPLCPYL